MDAVRRSKSRAIVKPGVTLSLTIEQALELFYRLQKPNPVDDYIKPLRDIRLLLAEQLDLPDAEQCKTEENVYKR